MNVIIDEVAKQALALCDKYDIKAPSHREMFVCGYRYGLGANPWHKASEELPEEGKNYLICYGWHPEVSVHTIARWDKRKRSFIDWSDYDDSEIEVEGVRYWMEIPEIKED